MTGIVTATSQISNRFLKHTKSSCKLQRRTRVYMNVKECKRDSSVNLGVLGAEEFRVEKLKTKAVTVFFFSSLVLG